MSARADGVSRGRSIRFPSAASVAILIACLQLIGCGAGNGDARADVPPVEVVPLTEHRPPVSTTVAAGDTLETVSRRIAGRDWVAWRDALAGEIDPRKLRPGTVFEGVQSPRGVLEELRVVLDLRSELIFLASEGAIECSLVEREVTSEVIRLEGVVESSLFGAVERAGGRPALAVGMAEIFRWDVDFLRDLRQGDSFVVIVDEQRIEGEFYRYGTIFAARFTNKGKALDAVVFPDQNGRLGYYDLDGVPLRKMFLRSPLKFSRVTSRFSTSRFHPVLKKRMPHYGVDYGAPVGTPVHVTADGIVTMAGRNGGAGNMVRVRHPNGYETNYLHLSRYGGGIRKGVRVTQGQVIGYVGSTGYSTGPHLDYRVRHNGSWINPLSISSPPVEPLEDDRLQRFLGHALAVLDLLEGREAPVGARC
ncbi:MAG: peptidoglycan DD-metalloendopeptidase family protein [Candidatus Sulfomarinibacteraceae bacterium]